MTDTSHFSFDRIATQYDAHREHPPNVAAQIGTTIMNIAGTGARVLELGVGTGRIALPVVAAGGSVIGIDLAAGMLHVAQRRGMQQLVRGDIACLPFRSATFDAVLAVHVLHLVVDWRGALAEAVRVLQPGGVLVQGRDWRDPQSCAALLRGKLRESVMRLQPGMRPPAAGAAVEQAVHKLGGGEPLEIVAAEWTTRTSPADVLANMAARTDAETWALPDDLLQRALADVHAWAEATWTDLDAPQDVAQRFVLSVVRGTWQAG